MTSTADGGYLPRTRDHYGLHYDRAGPIRVTSSIIDPRTARSPWGGLPNIWQTTPRAFQSEKGTIGQSPSLYRSDSSTRLPSFGAATHTELSDYNAASCEGIHPRNSPTFSVEPATSAHRSVGLSHSPARARAGRQLDVENGVSMSVLSNAALLNGSAPDVEPSLSKVEFEQQQSLEGMEDKLRTLNLARVNEFVPSQNQQPERPQRQERTSGTATSSGFLALQPGSHNNGHGSHGTVVSFGQPAEQISPLEHKYSSKLYQSECEKANTHELKAPPHNANWEFGGLNLLTSNISPPNLNNNLSKPSGTNAARDSHYTRSAYTRRAELWNGNPVRPEMYRSKGSPMGSAAAPVGPDAQSFANANRLAYLNNNTAYASNGQDLRCGFPPTSVTPITIESQRSNSGSGQSTQASSQPVESRNKPFETEQNKYQSRPAPYHNPMQQLPYQFYPGNQTGFPYNDAYAANHMVGMRDMGVRGSLEDHQDPDKPISPFLREFKISCKTKRYELKDIYGYIVEFSGDQHGSRFIQTQLETANSDEKEQVFTEIQENSLQLMTDIFGNYVIQKLFEHGTQAQKKVLANQMRGRVLYLTTQVYGCRVVQKALEHVLTDQQASMVKELEGHVLPIVENQNGNHVIQKAIERVPGEHIQFIVEAHKGQVVRLSKHNYGCRVVQRMLEHGSASVKRAILGELYESIPSLIVDQFGNYVMQHIIRNGDPADRFRIVSLVQQQLIFFSKHKFASNVVEAAIESAEEVQRRNILDGLTKPDKNGHNQVYDLIRDQYGNYVIQKVLQQLEGAALELLVREIKHHLVDLRRVSHGKQVSAMEKALAEASYAFGPDGFSHGIYVVGRDINVRPFLPQPFQSRYPPFG